MLVVALTSTFNIITLNIYYKGFEGKPVPNFIRYLFFNIVAKLFLVRISTYYIKS